MEVSYLKLCLFLFSPPSLGVRRHRPEKKGGTFEKHGHILQLGDVVLSVATVFGEKRQVL